MLKNTAPLGQMQGICRKNSHAELLAEDDLTAQQKEQVDAILRSTERTRNYLLKIRAEVQTPLKFKTQK